MNKADDFILKNFREHHAKCSRYTEYYAIKAAKIYLNNGITVPAELVPYLNNTLDARTKGKQNKLVENKTQDKQGEAVFQVRMNFNNGMSKTDAINLVADRLDTTYKQIKKWYDGTEFKKEKDFADELYTSKIFPK